MTAELPADTVSRRRAGDDRLVVVAVSLTAMFVFLWLAERVIQSGYVRRDIALLEAGDAWRRGGWLSQLVLWLVGFLPERNLRQTALSLLGAVAGGALVGMLYGRLRANGWFAIGAPWLVACLFLLLPLGVFNVIVHWRDRRRAQYLLGALVGAGLVLTHVLFSSIASYRYLHAFPLFVLINGLPLGVTLWRRVAARAPAGLVAD